VTDAAVHSLENLEQHRSASQLRKLPVEEHNIERTGRRRVRAMPLLKSCARCGVTLLFPTVTAGKCFCSPECEALYRDPEILRKGELEQPGVVRKRAAILLAITFASQSAKLCHQRVSRCAGS
jgi:hypothetical protein